ncbi:aldo/keto reductase [Candidatus Aerophobetes bacterium]|uniref:Aldo/keto reductase n=1 Tax=Aerophobetes bacterium TaxID=2030807 RepID=A0A523YN92_UNCAE|nr:MAG: aldo/keto reductase [Candidatus Aerophobetes bacterium]
MKYRIFGKTNWKVSEVGLGTWALGGGWGRVSESDAIGVLEKAIERGINFFDTADVYGDGKSEQLIGQVLKSTDQKIYVATKFGRRLDPHVSSGYTKDNLERFLDRSLGNLGVDTIDLIQLHCPPIDLYYKPEVFEALDSFVEQGKIQHYGVSVEKVEEGLKAIEYPGVVSVQIIFNIFRQRPSELFFEQCKKKNIAVIARVPLASGLLTGKMSLATKFPEDDHRNYNRQGKFFDVGETFSGVNFEIGLKAVEELKGIKPDDISCVQMALKWILMHSEVSCVIPGAKNTKQLEENISASELTDLDPDVLKGAKIIYEKFIKPKVHHRW